MRRPLKPFVTEYKASNRRNPGAPSEQGLFESDRPAPKPFDYMMKAESEDSYDAAMKAADALFSIPAEPKPETGTRRPTSDTAPQHMTAPQHIGEGSPQTVSSSQTAPSERGTGRILRVLDEQPPPEYAALEVEHAPKRRGRKPGSKNRPKATIAALVDGQTEAPIAYAAPDIILPIAATPAVPAVRKVPALVSEPQLTNGALAVFRGKRSTWGRDKLKPGEDWKRRRLPRVCW